MASSSSSLTSQLKAGGDKQPLLESIEDNDEYEIVDIRYYYISLNKYTNQVIQEWNEVYCKWWGKMFTAMNRAVLYVVHFVGYAAANAVTIGSNPEYWYVIMRNSTKNRHFVIEFGTKGISKRETFSIDRYNYQIEDLCPKKVIRKGIEKVDHRLRRSLQLVTTNCQTFRRLFANSCS